MLPTQKCSFFSSISHFARITLFHVGIMMFVCIRPNPMQQTNTETEVFVVCVLFFCKIMLSMQLHDSAETKIYRMKHKLWQKFNAVPWLFLRKIFVCATFFPCTFLLLNSHSHTLFSHHFRFTYAAISICVFILFPFFFIIFSSSFCFYVGSGWFLCCCWSNSFYLIKLLCFWSRHTFRRKKSTVIVGETDVCIPKDISERLPKNNDKLHI